MIDLHLLGFRKRRKLTICASFFSWFGFLVNALKSHHKYGTAFLDKDVEIKHNKINKWGFQWHVHCFQVELEFRNRVVFVEGGIPENTEKTLRAETTTNNKRVNMGNQTWATLEGSKRSHHCTIPVPPACMPDGSVFGEHLRSCSFSSFSKRSPISYVGH